MKRRLLIVFLLGFSSGLPFSLIGSTLQAWFAVDGLSVMTVGMLTLVGQPYIYKFLWAPMMDGFSPNRLGRRRGWIALCQAALVAGFVLMAFLSPAKHTWHMAALALIIAFVSASQDVAIDAFRAELLPQDERGLGASMTVLGYRLATLFSGGLALIMAQYWGWQWTYLTMAIMMLPGVLINLAAKEPVTPMVEKQSLYQSVVLPFIDLVWRPQALLVLLFIFLYKLGEAFTSTSSGIAMVFLIKGLHFDLATIGMVNKGMGIVATMGGSFIAGFMMLRCSLYRALMWFGVAQAMTNLLFLWLAYMGKSFTLLVWAVTLDNLAAGMGMTALIALLMAYCNTRFTATQFAVLSAIASLPRVMVGPVAGVAQGYLGWIGLYQWAFIAALPCLYILWTLKARVHAIEYHAQQKKDSVVGTEGGTRTHTMSPSPDFESGASTNSATPATE